MKRYNNRNEDLRLAKAIRINHQHSRPADRLVELLTEEHHKLCEEEITDEQFRDNVKLILR